MRLALQGLIAGLVFGGAGGLCIILASRLPLTPRIIYAQLATGAITGLLMGRVVSERRGWLGTLIAGGMLGALVAMPVALEAKVVPYVMEAGAAEGLLLAVVLKCLQEKVAAARGAASRRETGAAPQ